MIQLFRKFSPSNLFFLIVIGLVLAFSAFFHLPAEMHTELFDRSVGVFLGSLNDLKLAPQTNILITLFLTVIQAILLNRIVTHYNLLGQPTFIPALMYMTTASLLLPFLALSPALICNFFLIWMIYKLMGMYHKTEVKSTLFDVGMMVAAGSLFYFPFILFFPILWIALVIYRPFDFREWFAGIFGLLAVYFLLGLLYLWFDQLPDFYAIFNPLRHPFPRSFYIELHDYWVFLPLAFILVLFLNSVRENIFRSVVFARKGFHLLLYFLLISIVAYYVDSDTPDYHFLLCAPPLSIYLAYYFVYAKTRWFYETVYLIFLLTILYFQIF